jgi:hypothetical protein
VASAGEVTNDRHADLLVGAPRNDHSGTDSGGVYVRRRRRVDGGRERQRRSDAVARAKDPPGGVPGRAYVFSWRKRGSLLFTIGAPRTASTQ